MYKLNLYIFSKEDMFILETEFIFLLWVYISYPPRPLLEDSITSDYSILQDLKDFKKESYHSWKFLLQRLIWEDLSLL